jgi:choline dehydrogenase-like flavoprotein
MKASEQFRSLDRNPDQHGFNGPVYAQTVTSTGRKYPLRELVLGSWQEIGYSPAPSFDGNSGSPIGIADVCENRNNGRRQIASVVYPLDGITVLTETFVQNILINGTGNLAVAEGIKLANGTDIKAKHVVLSAGALRTPQLLMLSGVGPQDELQKYNIPVKVPSPEVGKNLIDHSIIDTNWKIMNPSQGWAPGSNNPLFQQPEFSLGQAQDFMVCDTVPRAGLIAAIAADEGAEPDESSHPLLKKDDRTFLELNLKYGYSKDGSSLNFQSYMMLSQTRGTVTLGSTNAKDFPIVDPKYFSTEVERYVHRQGLRAIFRLAGTDNTTLGRDILAGEVVPGSQVPLRGDITDAELDQRLKAGIRYA